MDLVCFVEHQKETSEMYLIDINKIWKSLQIVTLGHKPNYLL